MDPVDNHTYSLYTSVSPSIPAPFSYLSHLSLCLSVTLPSFPLSFWHLVHVILSSHQSTYGNPHLIISISLLPLLYTTHLVIPLAQLCPSPHHSVSLLSLLPFQLSLHVQVRDTVVGHTDHFLLCEQETLADETAQMCHETAVGQPQ